MAHERERLRDLRPSPRQRHNLAKARRTTKQQQARKRRAVEQQQLERERVERATPSRPPCVCLPGWCLTATSGGCTPCLSRDPELPCLREAS